MENVKNPWEEISLSDYESHMGLNSVMQLQALNELMRGQLNAYAVSTVMVLGVAGGNGLEHLQRGRIQKVYGVDINAAYLEEASRRHPELEGVLECLRVDLTREARRLPEADLVIADLLVEYIGYECFQNALRQVKPRYVSCVIQVNLEDGWVSDSPYLHAFDGLERVHCQMEEGALRQAMSAAGYRAVKTLEKALPNGKKLLQLDFEQGT